MTGLIHICAPVPSKWFKSRSHCPTCDRRTTQTVLYYEWYSPTVTCLSCGDAWSDGERLPRPFARGWRKRSIADARKLWAELEASTP